MSDEDGLAAMSATVKAAFGDPSDWTASIPARATDTDLTLRRWVRGLIAERDRLRAQLSALAEAALVVWGQRYDYDLDEVGGELPPMPEGWGCPVAVDLGDLAKLQALAAEVTRG